MFKCCFFFSSSCVVLVVWYFSFPLKKNDFRKHEPTASWSRAGRAQELATSQLLG